MMKHLFNLLLFLLFVSGTTTAQSTEKNDILLSYGIFTTNEIINITYSVMFDIVDYHTENENYTGTIILNYQYNLSNRLLLGGIFAFSKATSDAYSGDDKIGTEDDTGITFALESKYRYINKKNFQMYSGAGLGLTWTYCTLNPTKGQSQKSTYSYFDFQVIAAGLRFGNAFGGFIEVGIGYKGILNAGISYQF